MRTAAIAEAISKKQKGQWMTLDIRRPAKVRKGVEAAIEKLSTVQGMASVDYARRTAVLAAVEAGNREAPELPSWLEESFILEDVRFWRGKTGKECLPVCVTKHLNTTWLLNGVEVDFESIKSMLLASEYPKKVGKEELEQKGQVPFIGVGVENIAAIR